MRTSATRLGQSRKQKTETRNLAVESLDELKARGVAVVTKAQIAAAFQVSERTITKMMGRKEIPFFRLGERLVRFRVEEAIKHIEAGGKAEIRDQRSEVGVQRAVINHQWPVTGGKGAR